MDARSNMQGKARALATATRVSESCLGMALLRNHDGEDRAYMEKLRGLEKENRNVQNKLEHQRKQFLKRRLGTPGPLIIMEQTRSPEPLSKDGDGNGKRGTRPRPREADGRNGNRPRYMMPTMSRGTVTCSTSTIGAFRISTQRPLDSWNIAALKKVYFRSAVMPSWPLTESDLGELRTTLSRHCWIRKFRDPGQLASAESGNRSKGSKRNIRGGAGVVRVPSDEQVDRGRKRNGREEELKMPDVNGSQLTNSGGDNVRSRSHSQPTSVEPKEINHSHSTTKSAEIEQRYRLLPALTNNYRSNVAQPNKKPQKINSSALSKVEPLYNNEERFFKTSIEYSIPSFITDVRNPGDHDYSNNTVSSRTGKAPDSDALTEMTSTRNLLKSLRAVSFSDDVIKIGCRTTEIDGA